MALWLKLSLVFVVHGVWNAWQPWGSCSKSCGKGSQTRTRLCNSPPPSFGGAYCNGAETQMQVCNERHCPGERRKVRLPH